MNFTEVVVEVSRLTKRPDLLLDIRREVNAAVNFCCIEGNFARDFDENSFAVSSTLYAQSLPLSSFLRWRKFAYVRPSNRKKYIDPLGADKIFANNTEQSDAYYIAGDNVQFKLCALSSALLIGWFKFPPTLTDALPTFWLLDISPYMIINKAAASIFSQVGNTTETSKHEALFAVAFTSAVRDYKYGTNYG